MTSKPSECPGAVQAKKEEWSSGQKEQMLRLPAAQDGWTRHMEGGPAAPTSNRPCEPCRGVWTSGGLGDVGTAELREWEGRGGRKLSGEG